MRLRFRCALLLTAVASLAGAQGSIPPNPPEDRDSWVELQAAKVFNGSSSGLKDSQALGLAGGQWLTRRWGWEASLLRGTLQDKLGWSSTLVHLHGSALFNPLPELDRWRPFLRAGLGVSGGVYEAATGTTGTAPGLGLSSAQTATANTTSTTTRLSLVAGAGVQAFFGEHGFATLEGRALSIQVTPSSQRMESLALLGVGYRWGQGQGQGKGEGGTLPPVAVPTPPSPPPIQVLPVKPLPAPLPVPAPLPAPLPLPVPEPMPEPLPKPVPEPVSEPWVAPEPALPVFHPATPLHQVIALPRKIVLDETVLHFINGGAEVPPEGQKAIREVATLLKQYAGPYSLVVSGHTSSVGSRGLNKALSLRRAVAVAQVLGRAGIPARLIRTKGFGPDQPVASNATPKGQSRNRRVEIQVLTPNASVQKHHRSTPLAERAPRPRKEAPLHRKHGSRSNWAAS